MVRDAQETYALQNRRSDGNTGAKEVRKKELHWDCLLCLQREKFTHQDAKQLLQVAADDILILVERPAALLSIILVPGQICKDHLQPLLVVADLS